jgi:hypothetical protein
VQTRFPRFNPRVLSVFLIVALPVLVVSAVLVLGAGQARLRHAYGVHLTQVAENTAAALDTYVFRRILDVALLAQVPDVRASAAAGSRQPIDPALVRELDRHWQQERAIPERLADLPHTPASRFLRKVVSSDPIYREIMVTDREGRIVALSGLTSDYYQADEGWWTDAYDDGLQGRVRIGDVHWDESAGLYALEIAVPVHDPDDESLTGILKAVVDIRELLVVLGSIRPGASGEATLVRHNGSVVFDLRGGTADSDHFAAALLRERLTGRIETDPSDRFYFSARAGDGARLIGVARSQLGASYPELAWLVAVSQAEHELFMPIRFQLWSFVAMLTFVTVVVLALALWFSMRLAAPPYDVSMNLVRHPRLHRLDEEEADLLDGEDQGTAPRRREAV